nr:PREDICTED: utrophin-like [Latimeria chalumnae]|eukprot:XP_005998114.1 PREDICTED: utrophin-like [Latimeria chalumnae]
MAKVGAQEENPAGAQNEFSDIIKWRSDEHNDVQKKTFTKWINARLSKLRPASNYPSSIQSVQPNVRTGHVTEMERDWLHLGSMYGHVS